MTSQLSEVTLLNYSPRNDPVKNQKYIVECFWENDPSTCTNPNKTQPKWSKILKSQLSQAPRTIFVWPTQEVENVWLLSRAHYF